jgi:hypothetical protein
VTDLDDLPLFTPTPANPGTPPPRRCKRHDWGVRVIDHETVWACFRCDRVRDDVVTRRGKNNRARGNAIEREIGHRLGLRRVGQYGGPDDLAGDLFAVQVKSGGSFSERYWAWLRAVPVTAGQTPLLVVTDAPGPGGRRRAVVVLTLDDWISLHGPTGGTE